MKKLFIFCIIICSLLSCNTLEREVKARGNYYVKRPDGYIVEFFGYNPSDTLIERYPVKDTDSIEMVYDQDLKELRYYIVEENRYVVLSENYELLWYESR